MMLDVSKTLHLAGITEAKATQQVVESLVRSGRTPNPISIGTPTLVITTSAGIQQEVEMIKFGVIPMTPM